MSRTLPTLAQAATLAVRTHAPDCACTAAARSLSQEYEALEFTCERAHYGGNPVGPAP